MKKVSYIFILSLSFFLMWSSCSEKDDPSNPNIPTPTLTGFSPTSGTVGTTVTLTGTNFSTTVASNLVKFNGTTATVTAATATSLTVSVPAGSSTGKITVQVDNQIATSTSDFTINPIALTLNSFSPTTGPSGTNVNLVGTNFSTTAANNVVKFNGTLAIVTAAGPTSLAVTVPTGASTGKITVQVGSQVATSTDDFVYISTGSTSTVSTLAGSGEFGFAEGTGAAAQFWGPYGVAVDASGNVYVADEGNHRIRKITPTGTVSTLAGSGTAGFADGSGTLAQFFYPLGVAVDASDNVYVADKRNHCIRKITPTGTVSTLAGSGTAGFADGSGVAAQFYSPYGVAVDALGNVYVADAVNHRIRKVTPSGTVSTLAGSGTAGFADSTGTNAQFNNPFGVAVDASGNVYVADRLNHRIRKITPTGTVSTLAGSTYGSADGAGTNAQFSSLEGVTVDASGNVYVADTPNQRIRKITPSGTVSTLAGSATAGFADGSGTAAQFNRPTGVAVDASGNVYVADALNSRIRKIQ
jgi:sugar lactone lactonase YvrE